MAASFGASAAAWHRRSNMLKYFSVELCGPLHLVFLYTKKIMLTMRLKTNFFNRRLTASISRSPIPIYSSRACPVVQTRLSSATTEPLQPDAEGGTRSGPNPQGNIRYTSESYAFSATLLSLALTYADLDILKLNGIANSARYEVVGTPKAYLKD